MDFSDSSFFCLSKTRSIIPLNGKWIVYSAEDDEPQKISVNVPSIFNGYTQLIFEKNFNLTQNQVREKKIKIYFLGLNYLADIIVNDIVVYRHRGGEYPFVVELPRDILHSDKSNLLSVKLSYKLDSENSIPLKQRFLFPSNYGGIIRDVYLYVEPNVSIGDLDFNFIRDTKSNKVQLNLSEGLDNKEYRKKPDTLDVKNEYKISVTVFNPDQTAAGKNYESKFQLKMNEQKTFQHSLEISNPFYWSPDLPQTYSVSVSLSLDGNLIDSLKKDFAVYTLVSTMDELLFNGEPFTLNGVAYVPSFSEEGNLASFSQMEKDILLIKQTGFNSVRFAKSVPHPYYLKLCKKYGLLAFLEIPINYVPGSIAADPNFITRSKNYLTEFVEGYSRFGRFAAIGLGSSYLSYLPEHQNLIKELNHSLHDKSILTYASFTGMNLEKINELDLYGIEITGNSFINDTTGLDAEINKLGPGNVFISSVTYFVNAGNSSGYSNENTYEAQAKYFEDFLSAFSGNKTSGYFINSMFNYRGDFSSVVSGYNENNVYNIGLMSEDRNTAFLSQKVVQSKLHGTERVSIPIGTKNEESPIIFIIAGLVLALIIVVLVNSGRKFREDASRALLRPYNFFADVRDQRIMSSYHSTVLAFVLSVVMALLFSSLLFYLKDNIAFEKLLLATGSVRLTGIISYLAWNPLYALIWLTVLFIVLVILSIIVIKFASFFVRNRVYVSSIYFTLVWALIPLVLLIPLGIILYRALNADIANTYIYIGLFLFALWVFYRLMKGIYVIFDINAGSVYFYSIIIVLVLITAFILYYEIQNSFIEYLALTFKQYNIRDLL